MSSAANTITPGTESPPNSGTPRLNPVALEVLVSVTGAKPDAGGASRDLFFEDTKTVLVFKDGAVIRLAAPVAIGQLLFLTNKRSNQEVVCQVLRTRAFTPESHYVELLFTEDRADYWGVAFPESRKGTAEFKVADQVQAEQTTAAPIGSSIAPHSSEDVQNLKNEVDALRDQFQAIEKKNVEEAAAKAMADAAAAREAAAREVALREAAKAVDAVTGNSTNPPPPSATPAATPEFNFELPAPDAAAAMAGKIVALAGSDSSAAKSAAPKQDSHQQEDLLMPPAPKDVQVAARTVVDMSLPVWKMEQSPEEQLREEEEAVRATQEPQPEAPSAETAESDSLPEPALDFSQTSNSSRKAVKASVAAASDSGKFRTVGLVTALLLLLAGGAWYGKWWHYLPIGKNSRAMATAPTHPVAKPVANVPKPSAQSANPATANTPNPATKDSARDGVVQNTAIPEEAANANDQPNDSANANAKPTLRERIFGKKRTAPPADAADTQAAPAAITGDGPLLPAKLVKSVNAVYPPEAMRAYITGDVKAEVSIDPSGHVSEVKVLSGPKALRDAAADALKQYQYSPATQGGKPVASQSTEVVKFWFNP